MKERITTAEPIWEGREEQLNPRTLPGYHDTLESHDLGPTKHAQSHENEDCKIKLKGRILFQMTNIQTPKIFNDNSHDPKHHNKEQV
jgi:hypothetical protein